MSTVSGANSAIAASTAGDATTLDDRVFRRVFRFHPSAWRERNEAVAAGILMDVAEASGSSRVRLADRLSAYRHAASLWADRGINRKTRETVASLALGTGIAMGMLYFWQFGILPWLEGVEAYGPMILSSTDVAQIGLWCVIVAAPVLLLRWHRGTRLLTGAVVFVCLAFSVIRVAWMGMGLESVVASVFLGLWAVLAMLSRVRFSLVWKTTGIVAILVGAPMLYETFVARRLYYGDAFLWEKLAPFLLLGFGVVLVAFIALSSVGRGSTARAVVLYAVPWVIPMVAGLSQFQLPDVAVAAIVIAWICASIGVRAIITRYPGWGLIRATDPAEDQSAPDR